MKYILYFIAFCILISLSFYLIPIALIIGVPYLIYRYNYYKSEKFNSIKQSIQKYTNECNELNNHIENLKNSYIDFNKTDYGEASLNDVSRYKYKREELKKYQNNKYVFNCSLSVCRNAQQQPFKYLCKYFNIDINEENLNKFEEVLNNFSAAENGKLLLKNKKQEIMNNISNDIPWIIKKFDKKNLERKLGFEDIDFSQLYFPKYTFAYVSNGGNSSLKIDILFDINNLEKFIKFLSDNIKWKKSIAGQRALMTVSLRNEIKERDNYTCKLCKNSTINEPNLLLEIDHILPLSKGGITSKENLQTLCWKCNRSKGSKIYNVHTSQLMQDEKEN